MPSIKESVSIICFDEKLLLCISCENFFVFQFKYSVENSFINESAIDSSVE